MYISIFHIRMVKTTFKLIYFNILKISFYRMVKLLCGVLDSEHILKFQVNIFSNNRDITKCKKNV